jgi:hypothetical protein
MRTSWRAGTPSDTAVAGNPAAEVGELVAASREGVDTTDAIGFGRSSKSAKIVTLGLLYRTAICCFCAFRDSNVTNFMYEGTEFPI